MLPVLFQLVAPLLGLAAILGAADSTNKPSTADPNAALGSPAFLPSADAAGGFLTGLGFQGVSWLYPLALPPLVAVVAFAATRSAAFRKLRELT